MVVGVGEFEATVLLSYSLEGLSSWRREVRGSKLTGRGS